MKSNKLLGNGAIATAILASLCCITPVLAIVAGLSGAASSFTFLEPFRPYFIAITAIFLGYAFYDAYKPKKAEIECDCEDESSRKKFINSKSFLWIVAFVSVSLITFPYYSKSIFPNAKMAVNINHPNIVKAKLEVAGMTCTGCEASINYALKSVKGVVKANSSYKTGAAIVEYDKNKVNLEMLKKAVEQKTGYKVEKISELKKQKIKGSVK